MVHIVYKTDELIIVLHGLLATARSMSVLARRLRAEGFQTHLWEYASLKADMATHASLLAQCINESAPQVAKLHIVAHSMGCIVTRAALEQVDTTQLSRVVFLAPPNHGSPVARWCEPLAGAKLAPVRELADSRQSFVNGLCPYCLCETGILAARFDWLVPETSASLPQVRDFKVLNHTHNSLLFSRRVSRQVGHFLRCGCFPEGRN